MDEPLYYLALIREEGVEVTAPEYRRVLFGHVQIGEGAIHNREAITFQPAVRDWGVIRWVVLFDAKGQALARVPLRWTLQVPPGTTLNLPAGSISILLEESGAKSRVELVRKSIWDRLREDV